MGNKNLIKQDYDPDDVIIDGELIAYNRDKKRHLYVVPEGVKSIKERLFAGDTFVRRVELPEGLEIIGAGAFDGCHSLKHIKFPQTLKKIGSKAFRNCALEEIETPKNLRKIEANTFYGNGKLKSVKLNEGLEMIGDSAFGNTSLVSIDLPITINTIESYAFNNSQLKEVVIPEKLNYIEYRAFGKCDGLMVKINNRLFQTNEYMQNNLREFLPSLRYAEQNNKFYPNVPEIMSSTPNDSIDNFYRFSKDWKEVLELWKQNTNENITTKSLLCFYKTCFVLGLFQPEKIKNKEWSGVAKKFIVEKICKLSPEALEFSFENFYIKEAGFNPEYALFFMQNYEVKKSPYGSKLYFLEFEPYEGDKVSYNCDVYNNWNLIKKYYPNKTVLRPREKGSKNNNLTISNVLGPVCGAVYKNIEEGCEDLAIKASCYGYDDQEFKMLKEIWAESLSLSQKSKFLNIGEDPCLNSVITYEYMKNNDIETLFLGEESNCCQRINHKDGRYPLLYGATKPNAGFIKFLREGKLVGQSLIWYNKYSKIVCLDNIEIPETRICEMTKIYLPHLADCLVRLSKNIINTMNEKGYKVDAVTVGAGRNDARELFTSCQQVPKRKSPLPKDYTGYSDAGVQYVIHSRFASKSFLEQDEEKE